MKRINLVNFSELVEHATGLGYSSGQAEDILSDNGIREAGVRKKDFEITDFHDKTPDYDNDTVKIMATFMYTNEVDMIVVVND